MSLNNWWLRDGRSARKRARLQAGAPGVESRREVHPCDGELSWLMDLEPDDTVFFTEEDWDRYMAAGQPSPPLVATLASSLRELLD
jgi:hypothetical protein